MDAKSLIDGLILYLGLVTLLTFHEFGHAWVAWKCGDDSAYQEGRVSLNPLMHIDIVGMVLLPLSMLFFFGTGGFLVGWGRSVPVNLYNLRHPRIDDLLVTFAGPWMNLLLAILLMALAHAGNLLHSMALTHVCIQMSQLSLLLFFFNFLPIPPLDGSHVVRNLIGLSSELYYEIARYGFVIILLALQVRFFRDTIWDVTRESLVTIASWFQIVV